jgi:hypothetical protein
MGEWVAVLEENTVREMDRLPVRTAELYYYYVEKANEPEPGKKRSGNRREQQQQPFHAFFVQRQPAAGKLEY